MNSSRASTNTLQAFTPGPWKVNDDRADELAAGAQPSGWVSIRANKYDTVASAYNRGYETNMANARLIAAAPELLAALEPFAKFACDEPNDCFNCRARRAVNKAKGECEQANSKETK